ncbi:hypothetical protein F4810DRAFT_711032 [Camillea tinctor]|nr:hypothetical protein F4810DRAFT_711032 [Camillea tinctor]
MSNCDEWEIVPEEMQVSEPRTPIIGWLLPPIAYSIWAAIITKQSTNILLDIIYRVIALYEQLRDIWNDFCIWSHERQNPWAKYTYQVGYADPSENPKWRMKYTLEVRTWADMNTKFYLNKTNAKWYDMAELSKKET